jgi:hypothetical protein
MIGSLMMSDNLKAGQTLQAIFIETLINILIEWLQNTFQTHSREAEAIKFPQ